MSALKICPQCGTEYELDQRFCPKDGSTLRTQGSGMGDLVGSIIADEPGAAEAISTASAIDRKRLTRN